MEELFIGLMSGTSADGIDAVLVDFTAPQPKFIAGLYSPFPPDLRQMILNLCQPGEDEINRLGDLDVLLGKRFAETINTLLEKNQITPQQVRAIGSHGQTIRHHPQRGFTLQVGDPNIITAETGITTIADFRRRDIAHGGQGAPLVPAFHQHILGSKHTHRAVVNIGGIANITLLPADSTSTLGFDTGPGNTLMDAWIEKNLQQRCDENGAWAAQGSVNQELLETLLNDEYFKLPAPKSTGREYFNLPWLEKHSLQHLPIVDVQATLTALTAHSIINAIHHHLPNSEILICGGGVHNQYLMQQLAQLTTNPIASTKKLGVDPDWMEAMAFAWLAKQTLDGKPGNIAAVTGAKRATILGGIYSSN
jgi:anhydro-N-acetylmuramic acid kinase